MKSPEKDDHCHASHSTCMGMAAAGLGYKLLDDWLQKPVPLIFTFHLLKVLTLDQYERESWTMSADEKLNSLEALRAEGTDVYITYVVLV